MWRSRTPWGALCCEGISTSAPKGRPIRLCFLMAQRNLRAWPLGLKALYQVENAALAVKAALELLPDVPQRKEWLVRGLAQTVWPGRFDLRVWKGLPILLDGAHNVPGMWALRHALEAKWPGAKFRVLFSSKAGKQTEETLAVLAPLVSSAVVTTLPRFEGVGLEQMAGWFPESVPVEVVADPDEAWEKWLEGPPEPLRLCCGSLYLVGYFLALFSTIGPWPFGGELMRWIALCTFLSVAACQQQATAPSEPAKEVPAGAGTPAPVAPVAAPVANQDSPPRAPSQPAAVAVAPLVPQVGPMSYPTGRTLPECFANASSSVGRQ